MDGIIVCLQTLRLLGSCCSCSWYFSALHYVICSHDNASFDALWWFFL